MELKSENENFTLDVPPAAFLKAQNYFIDGSALIIVSAKAVIATQVSARIAHR